MEQIPLFPLGSVLFPYGRMALQIFEPRYLALVSHCMKTGTGFGVVLLRQGSEVWQPGRKALPLLQPVGCYGRIVDWDVLANGRLGVVIEGERRFALGDLTQAADKLYKGEVQWLAEAADSALPSEHAQLPDMLQDLLEYPALRKLNYQLQVDSALVTGWQLAQLLPVPEEQKYRLLTQEDSLQRLQQISDILHNLH